MLVGMNLTLSSEQVQTPQWAINLDRTKLHQNIILASMFEKRFIHPVEI